ncbi:MULTISPECIES: nuclear transport factor 2 family protein [unclassified Saccharopolyspora]|uniref:nuclear transport factor 2 family protein n=1 Tax=unclassified Saccharopolyspora TaxID=2646250 RepID=UPI001CD7E19C|nr:MULTISPECIES: nuclear transport factor 2 family protein [unclassified Saccharopolyspora]MCA1190205.1 nuclear transport factor 2 family protein [Saccharopolyspora sp. 6T]MCA1192617.1 nuclear transport factor 2 family protein [Saccharopolyspora sp. 6V]MCA1226660.1 nuclear transport factor 2 family protein [Saccharopolyspora sp. 6M]MCA1278955.1 nuclear transport factor 2 family protein [Saccharopolyspora sp. 7B]
MTDQVQPAARTALQIAQEFIRAVEAKDPDAVDRLLHPEVRQLFMHTKATTTPDGVADLIAGRRRGRCVADMNGKADVAAYTRALFDKFTPLIWRDHEWTVTPDGAVFFRGTGDMALTGNGKQYRNDYATRFDVVDGRIVLMAEYADALRYAGLLVRPNGPEFRGLLRALGRWISPRLSATSGR